MRRRWTALAWALIGAGWMLALPAAPTAPAHAMPPTVATAWPHAVRAAVPAVRPAGPVQAAREQVARDLVAQIRDADARTAQIADTVADRTDAVVCGRKCRPSCR